MEVSTVRNSIKIWSGDGLGDTEVLLSPVDKTAETGYTATYLTHGMPVEFDAEKDTWFKVGVNMQNPTNEDIIVYVEVENVEVRIVDEINSVIEWFDDIENSAAMDDESIVVTDYVYADDKVYGLEGIVQYADETGNPWKLAFIRDGVVYPVSQDWGQNYIIVGELSYLGNGIVQVYIEDTSNGALYQCTMEYTYDSEENHANFKATSNKVAD